MGGRSTVLAALIGRPIALPPAILRQFPELATVHWRRGGIAVRIAGFFLGQRSAAAVTLWRTVFLGGRTPLSAELLLHEFRHVYHFQSSVAFPLLYVWQTLRHGYDRNRYEADARAYAAERLRRPPEPSP